MLCDKILSDPDFGHLYIIVNQRAVRYTFRPANDGTPKVGIRVTVPPHYDEQDVLRSVENNRPQLLSLLQANQLAKGKKNQPPRIDWNFRIETDCLHISLVKGVGPQYMLHRLPAQIGKDEKGEDKIIKPAVLEIHCPPECDFDKENVQAFLERAIVEGIRNHAKIQLVPRLQAYALRYGIRLNEIKINSSKGRWGSCSQHKRGTPLNRQKYFNINLSLFTLLLPLHLQKLIMLHELTHTIYMDHSPAFHANVDSWLGGKEAAFDKELKNYKPSVFSFVKK